MDAWDRDVWQELNAQDKEKWMRELVRQLPEGMTYEGLQTFERFGQRTQTGVFIQEGQRFVFVPGSQVTLGWSQWQDGMDEKTSTDLHEAASNYGVQDVGMFLASQMSPVREVHISPMLVECETTSLGWIEVTEEEAYAQEHEDFPEALVAFKQSGLNEYELHLQFRLIRDNGGKVQILWFNEGIEIEDVIKEEKEAGFDLLTEDEWEYIYGGGCRTLFPWGDSFDYTLRLKHFGSLHHAENAERMSIDTGIDIDSDSNTDRDTGTDRTSSMLTGVNRHGYELELPNFFGVQFAGDPYNYELTLGPDGEVMPKGGDGGNLICEGTGPLLGYLPAASVFYRDVNVSELDWEELMDTLYYRRIIRLTNVGAE